MAFGVHNSPCASTHKASNCIHVCGLTLIVHGCSDLQSELLSEMSMLVQHSLADWQACSGPPDEHYQSTMLWALSILLLNPWLDNDQTGRR